jgi:uncharacterized protein (DUF305 family)
MLRGSPVHRANFLRAYQEVSMFEWKIGMELKRTRARASAILLFTFAALLALSACAPAPAPTEAVTAQPTVMQTEAAGGAEATNKEGAPAGSAEIDQMFIDMMVPHHEGAVAMAQTALERSQRSEIQEMANAIIASQEEEIGQMKAWRQEWYGSSETPPMSQMPMIQEMPGMSMGHVMDMQADVDALRAAPEPFDLAFIDAMIPHHQSAIDAAQMVLNAAVHPEMSEMARQVIAEQQKEIEQMQAWRLEWYPDAPPLEGSSSH